MKRLMISFLLASTTLMAQGDIDSTTEDLPGGIAEVDYTFTGLPAVEALIVVSQQNLSKQERLKELLLKYEAAEELYASNPDSKENVARLVNLAYDIVKLVDDASLRHLFDAEQLSEFSLFAKIAAKSRPESS